MTRMAVRKNFPLLVTEDLDRLVAFYREAFDAQRTYGFPDPHAPGHDVYVHLQLGGGSLGIGEEAVVGPIGDRGAVWLYVDDVDESYQRARDAGASVVAPPEEMPWGERVGQIRDPDGFLLYLGSERAGGAHSAGMDGTRQWRARRHRKNR